MTKQPENIEELTSTMDYMIALPTDVDKMRKEIEKSMEIYVTMDTYSYKYSEEEL